LRVLVLGATGMLGHKVWQVLRDRFDTWGTVRSTSDANANPLFLGSRSIIPGLEATDVASFGTAIDRVRPDAVINCIGIVKQVPAGRDPVSSIAINSLLPHEIAAFCDQVGARLVHVSTDCVFTGDQGMYTEDERPDAKDLYGRSKLLGEVENPHLTLRTSIIGREIRTSHGLVEWFLGEERTRLPGYTKAIFSGLPTAVFAQIIAEVVEKHIGLAGLYHVSSEPISKYDLLLLLRDGYRREVEIDPVPDVQIDRSLDSTRFRTMTGYRPEAWESMVEEMALDPTPYAEWRSSGV
jgi:dTDP-4-dehydrorhamnose reductase